MLLQQLQLRGLLLDVIAYNALASACGKGTQPQRALQLWEAMLHDGLLPAGSTYSALVSACGKGTQAQRALQLLEAMLHKGLLPGGIHYNALVSACGRENSRREPCSSSRQ